MDLEYNEVREKILLAAETDAREINISDSGITVLPPEIGQCKRLELLYLNRNALTALPTEIGQCTALKSLYLHSNQLKALPQEIGRCTALQQLYLHGNSGLGLPPEILGPTPEDVANRNLKSADPRAILDFYFSRILGVGKPLNEVKLVLVGRGGAGKTSLVERLVRDRFKPGHKETLGVMLCDWRMNDCPGGKVTAHVWDFAGQTITHAMHQFFLSVRTVYVLVLTGRENSEREDAEYWLRLIAAYGTDVAGKGPPVIVALNKWDDSGSARARLDRRALRERYPFIVEFVETDCATKTGIEKLRSLLQHTVDKLDWVRALFAEAYWMVKQRLESVPDPHLPYDDYRHICRECGVIVEAQQDLLAENLHALGVALNFRNDERLRFASVLKPHWLTENVYALVRHAEQKSGVLQRAVLPNVLKAEKEATMRQFLVDMMVRFEIAYPLAEEGTSPMAWLVPQALPDSQPEGVETFSAETYATRLRYSYRALPISIVPRFIVRTHPFIEGEMRWASGVVLTLNRARALVRADYTEKQIEITVCGSADARQEIARMQEEDPRQAEAQRELAEACRDLAGLAQKEFRFINGQIKGLNPVEEVHTVGEWVPVRTLERDENAKRQTGVATEQGTVEVDPTKELNEFSAPAARDESWKPRIFISYSHTDEAQLKKLELYLKVLVTHGLLHERWHDRKIQPGEDWDTTIKSELETADVIILLISNAALASGYIQTVEMRRALERAEASETVVVPLILEDCDWQLPQLGKLQALPKDSKPVREWMPQLKGWKNVSDGLKRLLERLRKDHVVQ